MNTSTLTDSHIAPAVKADVRALADGTVKAAREQVLDPALEAARRAGDFTRDTFNETRATLSRQASRAEHLLNEQYDRTIGWITANPLTAVGLALAAGVVLAPLFVTPTRR